MEHNKNALWSFGYVCKPSITLLYAALRAFLLTTRYEWNGGGLARNWKRSTYNNSKETFLRNSSWKFTWTHIWLKMFHRYKKKSQIKIYKIISFLYLTKKKSNLSHLMFSDVFFHCCLPKLLLDFNNSGLKWKGYDILYLFQQKKMLKKN